MTFEEIREEVRRRIAEVSATFWTDDEIDEAIHLGEDEFADATEWYERWQLVTILPYRPYYDLRSLLREPFLVAGPAFNQTTNRWLTPGSVRDLECDSRWEERYAEPEWMVVRGLWWMAYWPTSPNDETVIKQYYKALPTHMANADDEPGFHRPFHYGLVEFAVSDLLAQDAETTAALEAWKQYKVYENGLNSYMDGRNSVPQVHGHREA